MHRFDLLAARFGTLLLWHTSEIKAVTDCVAILDQYFVEYCCTNSRILINVRFIRGL